MNLAGTRFGPIPGDRSFIVGELSVVAGQRYQKSSATVRRGLRQLVCRSRSERAWSDYSGAVQQDCTANRELLISGELF